MEFQQLFITPPPMIRQVVRSNRSVSRSLIRCNSFDARSDEAGSSMARLLSLQKHVLKRREDLRLRELQTESKPENAANDEATQPDRDVPSPEKESPLPSQTKSQSKTKSSTKFVSKPASRLPRAVIQDIKPNIRDQPSPSPVSNSSTSKPSTDALINHIVTIRVDGRLPWKAKNFDTSVTEPEQCVLPLLTDVTKSCSYTRTDFLLPRYNGSLSSMSPQVSQIDTVPSLASTSSPASITFPETTQERTSPSPPVPVEVASTSHPVKIELEPNCGVVSGLNQRQREAVEADCARACLVLAGPGSGKTRVLTHRIAYLIKYHNTPPSAILAVTFTNKAAAEMKTRVLKLITEHLGRYQDVQDDQLGATLSVGTFHWICARLLRKYGTEIGVDADFQICDSSDSRTTLSRTISRSEGGTPDSQYVTRLASMISKVKNDKGEEMEGYLPSHVYKRVLEWRELYDRTLREMNMLDFDDLLSETRRMLTEKPDVLAQLQNRFQYVLVDEWQDTNNVQFDIVSLLSASRRNLFVVGDVDQSIYKFRGADSGNIQRYTTVFHNANQVMLSMNYRSTVSIVNAAQAVIKQDRKRPNKTMTTLNDNGDKVKLISVTDGREEGKFVTSAIRALLRRDDVSSYSNCAIMYRTNSQSRLLEEACVQTNIPYVLQSGIRFFERKEIKDILAYLRLLCNPADSNACFRIINVPARGIGKRTVEIIEEYANQAKMSMLAAIESMLSDTQENADLLASMKIRSTTLKKIATFHEVMTNLQQAVPDFQNEKNEKRTDIDVAKLISNILEKTGYRTFLETERESEAMGKSKVLDGLDNIEELRRAAANFNNPFALLERAALMSEQNGQQAGARGAVRLMTLHGAKGLEFDAVFITGAEDGIIPLRRDMPTTPSITGDEGIDIEEERRLLYVGMTRAKRFLTVTWRYLSMRAKSKKGTEVTKRPSRFLQTVPNLISTTHK